MSNLFFTLVVCCAVVGLAQQYVKYSRSRQRRFYWGSACLGAVAAFLAAQPDFEKGLVLAVFYLGAMTVSAYAYTPYIKIGGKVYALTVQDSQPDPDENSGGTATAEAAAAQRDPAPDAYSGLLTATKMWWLVVMLMVISAVNIYAFVSGSGEWWVAGIGAAFLLFLSVTSGLSDASWGYGIARGQHVQFVLASVVTVGTFAVIYMAAYQAGKRRPLRNKHSMEYRAHPRHQDSD